KNSPDVLSVRGALAMGAGCVVRRRTFFRPKTAAASADVAADFVWSDWALLDGDCGGWRVVERRPSARLAAESDVGARFGRFFILLCHLFGAMAPDGTGMEHPGDNSAHQRCFDTAHRQRIGIGCRRRDRS